MFEPWIHLLEELTTPSPVPLREADLPFAPQTPMEAGTGFQPHRVSLFSQLNDDWDHQEERAHPDLRPGQQPVLPMMNPLFDHEME